MENEPQTGTDIDSVISAELPTDPDLLLKVKKHVMHSHYPERCYRTQTERENEICHYDYPKPLNGETYLDEAGYPHYKRRHEEDRNVVPYNPQMLKQFDCHINVELASSVTLIMYLYKYIYKGHDQTQGTISKDDIKQFLAGRLLTASEATWRLFGYELTRRRPAVTNFPVHLENQNFVVYDSSVASSKEMAVDRVSKLERYFARPDGMRFDSLRYMDYYEQFTVITAWQKASRTESWTDKIPPPQTAIVRKRTQLHICRMDAKRLQSGELWYLRLLLQHKQARSYEDLRTVDSIRFDSFSDAAKAMGLLDNKSEFQICMQDARDAMCTPQQLRFLFIVLITEGAAANVLFQEHENFLRSDFKLNKKMTDFASLNALLHDLAMRLESYGKTLSDYMLPEPTGIQSEMEKERARHCIRNCKDTFLEYYCKLNSEQRCIFSTIQTTIDKKLSQAYYIDGGPGRGKSFLLKTLVYYTRSISKIALCCASSGFVAVMYPGGRIAHGLFKIPVKEDDYDLVKIECDIPNSSQRAELLKNTSLIIWDEITMINKHNLEAVDAVLRKICKSDKPFGGIVFVGAEDFRKIPPILRNGTRDEIILASIKFSPLWEIFQKHKLIIPVRQQDDREFAKLVDSVSNGTLQADQDGKVILDLIKTTTDTDEWTRFVYPDIPHTDPSTNGKSLLTLFNKEVDKQNEIISDTLPGHYVTLYSHDDLNESSEISEFFKDNVTTEFFNQINFPNVPPHELKVKVGMECFIVRNLSPDEGILNNTQVKILHISKNLIQLRHLENKNIFFIPRITFSMVLKRKGIKLTRKQFPLRAGYVKTFNRSQGATLDRTGLDLRSECFCHGQLAVAISRVRTRNDLLILTTEDKIDANKHAITTNVVYQELLL